MSVLDYEVVSDFLREQWLATDSSERRAVIDFVSDLLSGVDEQEGAFMLSASLDELAYAAQSLKQQLVLLISQKDAHAQQQ